MKRYILFLFISIASFAIAASNIDNKSKAILLQIKHLVQKENILNNGLKSASSRESSLDSIYYPVIIKLSNDSVIDDLKSLGTVIFRQRENFILASIPYSKLEEVSRMPLVNQMSLSSPMALTLDEARKMTNVSAIQQGVGLPQPYDGSGVVVGLSDTGFDPSHPNFTDGRLMRFVHYDEIHALRYDMTSSQEMLQFADSTNWHATHVAGILAGSYKGVPYWGTAPGADIVATTSSLYDMAILAGAEDVLEYANKTRKRAVINMSLGYYLGPHDGSSLFNQYLGLLGEEAIICLSSGNEGKNRVYIPFDAKKDRDELKTFVYDSSIQNGVTLQGGVDFWSADNNGFHVALTIYDRNTKSFVYTSPYIEPTVTADGTNYWGIASSSYATDEDVSIPLFESDLMGAIRLYSSLNIDNNRYNVYATVDVKNRQFDTTGVLGRYCIGFIAKPANATHIDVYADGTRLMLTSIGVEGFKNGTPSRSISDLACGENVVVVGASNSRNVTPKVNGGEETYNFNVGNVASFSSYGTLDDGRQLPHFCAPGNMIVSSMNSKYKLPLSAYEQRSLATKETIEGKDYYWIAECGTSMASPHAAGIIACWLQADSTLMAQDIIDIAQMTANHGFADYPNPQWGAGNIDAYAGLKEVLKRSGVGNILADECPKMLLRSIGWRQFEIEVPQTEIKEVQLYSSLGQVVYEGKNNVLNVSSLPQGIYIIRVLHTRGEEIDRILIK